MTTRAIALAHDLRAWQPVDVAQRTLRDEYIGMLAAHPLDALDRDGGPEHITGSCFVLTPDLAQVLLCYHRKGRFWVQVGGHVEADDASVADGAFREAHEESGIGSLTPWSRTPVDVNRHSLARAFGRCRVHWDVGYVVTAPAGATPVTSDESEDVAWFPVAALPDDVPDGFAERLALVLAEVAHRS
ncbi:hypothetical protein GCM10025865_15640 [Paraoerskovia sediminicola]|uniref:Nudix hydrolase domain-containing protein n=1 Tax=Paraoerskovia sediminicola TaxID=1138587 RepID=A0ABN6XC64_9CELL|nr:NUDIX domain-containing protein [Paraoerskovia sediminicola]BDZ42265.1 hypothetical protein GCM10025865_15640 [Paraoerskovia sediminicola]